MSSTEDDPKDWLPESILWALLIAVITAFALHSIRSPWNIILPIATFLFQIGWTYLSLFLHHLVNLRIDRWQLPPWAKWLDTDLKKPFSWHVIWEGPIFIVSALVMIVVGRLFVFFPMFLVITLSAFFKK